MTRLSNGGYNFLCESIQILTCQLLYVWLYFQSIIPAGYNCLKNKQKIQVRGLDLIKSLKWLPQCVELVKQLWNTSVSGDNKKFS